MTLSPTLRRLIPAFLLVVAIALLIAACTSGGTASPGVSAGASAGTAQGSAAPSAAPSPSINPNSVPLHPAVPGSDPFSTIAWLFTPLFQALLILLVSFEQLTGNMVIAIIIVTLIVRFIQIPLFRRQTVSTRRMQLVQPELKEIQKRYKGDQVKTRVAQQELFKERGINPLAGCLPMFLFLILLLPMYQVFSSGLQNVDPTGMLTIFGVHVTGLECGPVPPPHASPPPVIPCIDATVMGIDWAQPNAIFHLGIPGTTIAFGISILALISALLQVFQTRMTLPPASAAADDPNARIQRQTMVLIPFMVILYGASLPAGLFIYWIVSTIFSIVQQYLIIGWGGMFPLFGWTPSFATAHTPRFPVAMPPPPDPSARATILTEADKKNTAEKTIRPRERGRQGRRGRRR